MYYVNITHIEFLCKRILVLINVLCWHDTFCKWDLRNEFNILRVSCCHNTFWNFFSEIWKKRKLFFLKKPHQHNTLWFWFFFLIWYVDLRFTLQIYKNIEVLVRRNFLYFLRLKWLWWYHYTLHNKSIQAELLYQ